MLSASMERTCKWWANIQTESATNHVTHSYRYLQRCVMGEAKVKQRKACGDQKNEKETELTAIAIRV